MNVGSKQKRELELRKCPGMCLDQELAKEIRRLPGVSGVSGAAAAPPVEMERKLELEHVLRQENVQETVNKQAHVIFLNAPHGHPGVGGVLAGAHVEMERKLELGHAQGRENVQETVNKQTNVIFLDVTKILARHRMEPVYFLLNGLVRNTMDVQRMAGIGPGAAQVWMGLGNGMESALKSAKCIRMKKIHALRMTFIMLDLDSISLAVTIIMGLLVRRRGVNQFVKRLLDALGLTG